MAEQTEEVQREEPRAAPTPPVVIVKKVAGHGGHHGGAWKVAYADFVTAMMALFIVLWLLSSSAKVKEAVASYFQDPTGTGKQTGSSQAGTGETLAIKKDDMSKLQETLESAMKQIPEFQQMKDQVRLTITGEGLRIELLETEKGLFFQSGNSKPSQTGQDLLLALAQQLAKLPNNILLEGHTDSKPFAAGGAYGNWELSADRANSARRLMQANGLRPDQVVQVRGFADQKLWNKENPDDPSNRRISVIVQYRNIPAGAGKAAGGENEKTEPAKPEAPAEKKAEKKEEKH
jgi:chemotaxis protein MotB